MNDDPAEVDDSTPSGSEGALDEEDLLDTSFVERRTVGGEETALSGGGVIRSSMSLRNTWKPDKCRIWI
ncbi:hypothetical protein PC120_g20830 [Phytophthora cactorum]|nr:hypothetical protein PC120_g20830 [Phytophthora cactorum]